MLIGEGENHRAGKEQLASLKDKGEALLRHFSCVIYAVDISPLSNCPISI